MSDSKKTKKELIAELSGLRRKVLQLEKNSAGRSTVTSDSLENKPLRAARKRIKTDIEFIGDFDIIKAKGVDISVGGICFRISGNLPFEMRFKEDEKTVIKRAHLIWLKHLKQGGYKLGLKFVDNEETSQF